MKKAEPKLRKGKQAKPAARTQRLKSTLTSRNGDSRQRIPAKDFPVNTNAHGTPDYRLETTPCSIVSEWTNGELRYKTSGDLKQPVPPLRESRYLSKDQSLEIYRYMLMHRRLEETLELLYKQSKVVGGVYFGLGQEGCSVAAAYALEKDDWLGPMIRNQGAALVRGFKPRDTMLQYMAKADSPTRGRDGASAFGDYKERNMLAPISHLGDSIPVLAGIALGARLQGKNIACLTFLGDGGQSTGSTYEGFNFAAVQKLGVILLVENNLWAYSTPVELQSACKDLADRSIAYGVPGAIVDGTDPNQVYDVVYEAVRRAHRGQGATLIEAKLLRMKGHAIHDAAAYVPEDLKEYWRKRDSIVRMKNYLLARGWLTDAQDKKMLAEIDQIIEEDRAFSEAAAMPKGEEAALGVYCDNAEEIPLKYGQPIVKRVNRNERLKAASDLGHLR